MGAHAQHSSTPRRRSPPLPRASFCPWQSCTRRNSQMRCTFGNAACSNTPASLAATAPVGKPPSPRRLAAAVRPYVFDLITSMLTRCTSASRSRIASRSRADPCSISSVHGHRILCYCMPHRLGTHALNLSDELRALGCMRRTLAGLLLTLSRTVSHTLAGKPLAHAPWHAATPLATLGCVARTYSHPRGLAARAHPLLLTRWHSAALVDISRTASSSPRTTSHIQGSRGCSSVETRWQTKSSKLLGWLAGRTRALRSEAPLARARATRGGRGWPSERSQECDCSSCPRDAPVPFSPSNSPRKTPKPAGGRVRPSVRP